MATADVAQVYVEVFHSTSATSTADVSQAYTEVFHTTSATSTADVSQVYVEVFHEQPTDINIIGDAALTRGRTAPTGGTVTVTSNVLITGDAALTRGRVAPTGGSLAPLILGDAPLVRSRVFPTAGAVIKFVINSTTGVEMATETSQPTPTIILYATPTAAEMALRASLNRTVGGNPDMTFDLTHIRTRIVGHMPMLFINTDRAVFKFEELPYEEEDDD
jgi:hypothetical protein